MKLSLNFLNRWECAIFKKYNANHSPISSFAAIIILCAAFAIVISLFLMKMFNAQKSTIDTVDMIIVACAFIPIAYKIYQSIKPFSSIGAKIGFTAYILAFFVLCSFLSIMLAQIVLFIVLACLVLWIALLAIGGGEGSGPDGKKKKITVYHNDGSSEEMEETGRGVCGETYYENYQSGRTHVEP